MHLAFLRAIACWLHKKKVYLDVLSRFQAEGKEV
jgi:hypothetical protein